jgi:ATP-dependent Lon protease
MARDNQTKLSKKETNRAKKREELIKRKKKNEESDSDSNSESDEEMNEHEYRKFLSKMFPSKHLSKKIKSGEKLKKLAEELSESSSDSEEEEKVSKKKRSKKNKKIEESSSDDDSEEEEKVSKKKKSKKGKKIVVSDDEEETEDDDEEEWEDDEDDDEDDDDEEDDDDDDEDDEDDEDDDEVINGNKVNIIFTIGGVGDEDEDDEEEYDSDYEYFEDDDEKTENEDEEVSSDESEEEEEEVSKKNKSKKSKKSDKKDKKEKKVEKGNKDKKDKKDKKSDKKSEEEEDTVADDAPPNQKTTEEMLSELKELFAKNPRDKSIKKCIKVYENDIKEEKARKDKKERKQKDKNLRIFRKIIRDKNTMNDFAFYEKLEMENQKKLIKELREINKITRIEKPYRMTLLESTIPVEFKAAAMKKINSLKYMDPGSGDFYKIKNWVDTFMHIPFTSYNELPISIEDGVEKCHDFMENAQKTLDSAVYGLNDAKMQIMQMLGQLLTNPKAIGTAIAIHGPPGTGKTSLVKEGISKILNRPFAFIALGGATDSSFLEGHSYTYEGSTWGKIVQILIDSKCMNPVIYFDELDKISETPRGEEIAGILTHLTDTSQNSQFHDKYFAEINFDLSKCLFIFSYNDESKVNPILKDRMYRIKTKGYSGKEKTIISNNYLLPKICEQVKFNNGDIIIPDDVVNHIIETHCNKEDGVRNLKRCLEIIHTKLNLYRLMKPGSNLFEGEMSLQVEFPFKITKDIVDKLIKKETENQSALWAMYC